MNPPRELSQFPVELLLLLLTFLDADALISLASTGRYFATLIRNFLYAHRYCINFSDYPRINSSAVNINSEYLALARRLRSSAALVRYDASIVREVRGAWPAPDPISDRYRLGVSGWAYLEFERACGELYGELCFPGLRLRAFSPSGLRHVLMRGSNPYYGLGSERALLEVHAPSLERLLPVDWHREPYADCPFPRLRVADIRLPAPSSSADISAVFTAFETNAPVIATVLLQVTVRAGQERELAPVINVWFWNVERTERPGVHDFVSVVFVLRRRHH